MFTLSCSAALRVTLKTAIDEEREHFDSEINVNKIFLSLGTLP